MKLAGKIALVTGASRGIGRAVAEAFAREGAEVLLLGRDVAALEATDDAIQAAGGKASIVPIDLRESGKIQHLSAIIAERYGRLDILVGNAGVLGDLTPLAHTVDKIWDEVLATNLTANWHLIRAMDPLLRKAPAGRAIFVSSGVTQHPMAYWGAYSVSKAGLEMLVKVYAAETAKTNLRVNLIDPGEVATKMHAAAFPGIDPATLAQPSQVAQLFLQAALPTCRVHGEILSADAASA